MSSKEQPQLKPCPFCGSTNLYSFVLDFKDTVIECKGCGVMVYGAYHPDEKRKTAETLWNRRANGE